MGNAEKQKKSETEQKIRKKSRTETGKQVKKRAGTEAGKQDGREQKKRSERSGKDRRNTEIKKTEIKKTEPKQHWGPGNMLYPLPAVMVSCARDGEKPNIITVAWAGTVCTNPPMVSISVRPERYSYAMIRETGEFVINLTTQELAQATDFCGVRSGRTTDKFQKTGLTAQKAVHLKQAPVIAECPVNIECQLEQVLELGSHHMFLAKVVGVSVDSAYLDEKGKLHLSDAGLMVYSHGTYHALGKILGTFGYSVKKKEKTPHLSYT